MTTRGLTAGMLTAIAAGTVRPAIFYEGEYVSGSPQATAYLRMWTGVGSIVWDGKTWTGGGQLLSISPLEETAQLRAIGFTVTLSGMPSALVSVALGSVRQGRPGTLWLGCFDAANALIADPYQLQKGRFDIVLIEDSGETCTIAAQYESRLVDLEKPRERFYTPEDQKLDYPDDEGFAFVASIQDGVDIPWDA